MRRALSIILATVLVTTPIKVMLAQAAQQESQAAVADSTRMATDQTPTRIGVPVVEPNSGSALLLAVAMRDHAPAGDALTLSAPFRRASTAKKILIVVAVVAGLLVAIGAIAVFLCNSSNCFD